MTPRLLFIAIAFSSSPALAQERSSAAPAPAVAALGACRGIQNDAERLACFDRAAAALLGAVDQGQITVLEREQVQKARRSLFGFGGLKLPFVGRDRDEPAEPTELVTTLASLREIGRDRYRFSVQDGDAVWDTAESAYLGKQPAGTKVTIRKGALGSYFARIGRNQWVRARRVK